MAVNGIHPRLGADAISQHDVAYSAILVLTILITIYTITYSGAFQIDDEHILASRSQSLAYWGKFYFPQVYGNDRVRTLSTVLQEDATPDVSLEPAQAILGAGFFKLAALMHLGGVQTTLTMNVFFTALTGVVVFLTLCLQDYERRTAICCALLFGLGTMAWPFAKRYYRDTLAMFMVAISYIGWTLTFVRSKWRRFAGNVLIGLGVICGLLAKLTVVVAVPAFILSILIVSLRQPKRRDLRKNSVALIFAALLLFFLTAAIPDRGVLARFSLRHFIEVGKRLLAGLEISTLLAIVGPFLSPAKSVFLFSPILILTPFACVRKWKDTWQIRLPAVLIVIFLPVAQALFHGELWGGTLTWGLRFMLPAMPMMILLCAPLIKDFLELKWSWRKAVWWGLVGVTLIVQVAGVFVPWHLPFQVWSDRGLDPYSMNSIWKITYLAIPVHIMHLLEIANWDIAWIHTLPLEPLAILVPVTAIVLCAAMIGLIRVKALKRRSTTFRIISTLTVGIFVMILPLFPSLYLLQENPANGGARSEFDAMYAWVKDNVQAGDLVVVDAYGTPIWHFMMNQWKEPIPWFSLPFEIPGTAGVDPLIGSQPSSAAIQLFQQVGPKYNRLWYIYSDEAPDAGLCREITWLDRELVLLEEHQFTADTRVEARLYKADIIQH
jgi:hypothetical protein